MKLTVSIIAMIGILILFSSCTEETTQPVPGSGGGRGTADDDGDGIPNFEDPDFVKGTGDGAGTGNSSNFIDTNDNGIGDRLEDFDNDGIINGEDEDWLKENV